MGRKGRRAKTKTVLKTVNQVAKLGSMQNLIFQTDRQQQDAVRGGGVNAYDQPGRKISTFFMPSLKVLNG